MKGVWDRIAAVLRRSVPRQQFETWFRGMRLDTNTPEHATFSVPNNFLREWILRKYFGVLRRAVREVTGNDPEVEILISAESDPEPAPAAPPAASAAASAESATRTKQDPYTQSDIVLNPQYTFDNFVPGPSNNFGYAAALAVADSPGKSYNPLFLHGSVGPGEDTPAAGRLPPHGRAPARTCASST